MASAELLEITHSIHGDVQGVDNRLQGIGSDVQVISSEVRGVDDKLDQVNRSLSLTPAYRSERSDIFTGNQLRDSLLRWLSPPDSSINHNIACKAHHNGTAQWFLQGSVFSQWKSTDPFLWIYGKRVLLLAFTMRRPLIISCLYSRFGEKCRLVRPLTHSVFVKLTCSIQFLDYTRYHGLARHWEGIDGLFLF